VLSIVVSTIVYFVAAFFISRYLEETGIPKGMTRSISVFVLALAVAYGVAWVVDSIV
jgi:VIT1/CCC1 family predicted Fe2+/Mn2+ transporter